MNSEITYRGAHLRIGRLRGKASKHRCGCGQPAQEWAYRGGCSHERTETKFDGRNGTTRTVPYSPDPMAYDALCRSCHGKRDHGGGWNSRKTHCKYGHAFAGDNLRIQPNGDRSCRTCLRANTAKSYRKYHPIKPRPSCQALDNGQACGNKHDAKGYCSKHYFQYVTKPKAQASREPKQLEFALAA